MNDVIFDCKELGCGSIILYNPEKERVAILDMGGKYKRPKDYDVYLRCRNGHTYKYWIHEAPNEA